MLTIFTKRRKPKSKAYYVKYIAYGNMFNREAVCVLYGRNKAEIREILKFTAKAVITIRRIYRP